MFFISFAAFSSWLSYFNVYLKEVPHLSGFEIGIIAALQQFNTLFIVPIWGMFADKYGRKRVLGISLFLSTFFLLIFMVDTQFIYYILFMIIFTSVYNPLSTLIDSIGLDFEEESKTISYGEIRLWGSIGWAVSSIVTGQFINDDNLSMIFPVASGLLFISTLITVFIYKPLSVQRGINVVNFDQIKNLLKGNTSLLNFLILIFMYAVLAAPTYLFINMYYNEIGATTSQIGLAYGVQAFSELPFFFFGKRIIKKFGSIPVFVFVLIITAVRMVFYGLNDNPWLAIAAGVFQGLSIALFLLAVIEYVHNIVPNQLRSTGQSLIYTFFSVGICFGNLFAGYMKDSISIQNVMIINAVFILILVLLLALRKRVRTNNRHNT